MTYGFRSNASHSASNDLEGARSVASGAEPSLHRVGAVLTGRYLKHVPLLLMIGSVWSCAEGSTLDASDLGTGGAIGTGGDGSESGGTSSMGFGGGAATGTTGGATSSGGSSSIGGSTASGGSAASGGSSAGTGGAASGGASGSGGSASGGTAGSGGSTTIGTCDWSKAACAAKSCATVCGTNNGSYCQDSCEALITCVKANPSCSTADDPLCIKRTNNGATENTCTKPGDSAGGVSGMPTKVATDLFNCACAK